MFLIGTYIFEHLISPLLLRKREIWLLVAVNIAALAIIYGFKADTYDLQTYTAAMDSPWIFEAGYAVLTIVLKALFVTNRAALYAVQVLLAALFCVPVFIIANKDRHKIAYLIIVFLSVGFTLGVNNAIRQAYSALFIVISFLCLFQGKLFRALLFFVLCFLFHTSGVAFYGYILVIYIAARLLYFPVRSRSGGRLNPTLFLGILLIVSILSYFALSSVLSAGFYKGFGEQSFDASSVRTSNSIKITLIVVTFIVSELLFGRYDKAETYFADFRLIRASLLALVVGLSTNSMYYELSARVLYFYFVVEAVLLVAAYHSGKRGGVAIVMASYAFALNVFNILTG